MSHKLVSLLIPLCLILLIQTSCNSKKTEYSKDFSFKITQRTSEFDSKTGRYTRKYNERDSSVYVMLDRKELQRIQTMMLNVNFEDFPEYFECSQNGTFIMPSFDTTIEITIDGKLKKTTNTSFCSMKVQQKMADDFENVVTEILRILDTKKEIKNMRKTDMFFM